MPRSFTGDSVEEQELARLLDQVLRDLGVTTLQLTKVLRADQFAGGKIPAQATVYRYLRGEQLMRKGAELIDAILEQCTEERRKELRRQVRELIRRHGENRTPLPPSTPEEIEGRIKGLERDWEEVERERVAAQRAG